MTRFNASSKGKLDSSSAPESVPPRADHSLTVARTENSAGNHLLAKLLGAALAIPAGSALAEGPPPISEIKLVYFDFQDWQSGGEDRMHIKSPMIWFATPLGDSWSVEGTLQLDDISGASPQYLDSLSGASGVGINDRRQWGDVRVSRYFERFSLSLGGAVSTEDDYISRSASIEGRWWTEDKNTTVSFGISPNFDRITSSNDGTLLERRRAFTYLVGLTQVLSPNSLLQSNFSYATGDGYHSDPYKFFDKRPTSRDQFAWLTRHNYFVAAADAALHTDYRFYWDSWSVQSHLLEVKWYQPLGEHFMVRPGIRYYSQDSAEFFSSEFPPLDENSNYSPDQRLASYGSLSYGLKVEYAIGEHVTLDALVQFIEQRGSWKLFGSGNSELKDYHARYTGVGVTAKF